MLCRQVNKVLRKKTYPGVYFASGKEVRFVYRNFTCSLKVSGL